jgi:hypothetical protein
VRLTILGIQLGPVVGHVEERGSERKGGDKEGGGGFEKLRGGGRRVTRWAKSERRIITLGKQNGGANPRRALPPPPTHKP